MKEARSKPSGAASAGGTKRLPVQEPGTCKAPVGQGLGFDRASVKRAKRCHVLTEGYVSREQLGVWAVWQILYPGSSVTFKALKYREAKKRGEKPVRVRVVLEEL